MHTVTDSYNTREEIIFPLQDLLHYHIFLHAILFLTIYYSNHYMMHTDTTFFTILWLHNGLQLYTNIMSLIFLMK